VHPILQVIDYARKLILANHSIRLITYAHGDFLNLSDIM